MPYSPPPVNPSTLSRLAISMSSHITGITSGVETFAAFNAVNEVVGSDIAIDGVDDTKINILTDGVYAASVYLGILGTFTETQGSLYSTAPGFIGSIDEYLDVPCTARDFVLPFTWYMEAGEVLRASTFASTSAGTWTFNNAYMWVQRVV